MFLIASSRPWGGAKRAWIRWVIMAILTRLSDRSCVSAGGVPSFYFVVLSFLLSPPGSGRLVAPLLLGWGRGRLFEAAPPLPGWGAALGAPGPLVLLPGAPLLGGAAGGGASLPPLCLGIAHSDHARNLPPMWLKFHLCFLKRHLFVLV